MVTVAVSFWDVLGCSSDQGRLPGAITRGDLFNEDFMKLIINPSRQIGGQDHKWDTTTSLIIVSSA